MTLPGFLAWRSLAALAVLAAAVLVLAPAWTQDAKIASDNALAISEQHSADLLQGRQMNQLLGVLKRVGVAGRVYAGDPSNWGADFTVGQVPVYKYLAGRDVDEVGFTLRTASLMTQPEFHLDAANPSDYILFGIRYVIQPRSRTPQVPAHRLAYAGPYSLWEIPYGGYVHAGVIAGTLGLDRTDAGARSVPLLGSDWAARGLYQRVAYGRPGVGSTFRAPPGGAARAGVVGATAAELAFGRLSTRVRMRRAGVIVLSVSFDPGWRATVDGRPVGTFMVAPALVGVPVGVGVHAIVFTYRGYGGYAFLLPLAALTSIGLAAADVRRRRRSSGLARPSCGPARRSSGTPGDPGAPGAG